MSRAMTAGGGVDVRLCAYKIHECEFCSNFFSFLSFILGTCINVAGSLFLLLWFECQLRCVKKKNKEINKQNANCKITITCFGFICLAMRICFAAQHKSSVKRNAGDDWLQLNVNAEAPRAENIYTLVSQISSIEVDLTTILSVSKCLRLLTSFILSQFTRRHSTTG